MKKSLMLVLMAFGILLFSSCKKTYPIVLPTGEKATVANRNFMLDECGFGDNTRIVVCKEVGSKEWWYYSPCLYPDCYIPCQDSAIESALVNGSRMLIAYATITFD